MIAPVCQHETRKKHGHDRHGNQRYRCLTCCATFVDEQPPKPLGEMRTDVAQAKLVLRLLTEGMSIRATERTTGIHRDTICRLVVLFGNACREFLDKRMTGLTLTHLQFDEQWSYVAKKQSRPRRRLQVLVSAGLLNRHRAHVVYPNSAPAGSVYYPSIKGLELLAEQSQDDSILATPTQPPQPHHVCHWLAVSRTHIKLDAAIAAQNRVVLHGFVNEWDTVNKNETEPEKRYRLYTRLNSDLVCAPDAAFMLTVSLNADPVSPTFSKVFYLEQDRATSGVKQVAARKCKGYAELANAQLHVKQFPQTNVNSFSVLCIAPSASRRDALRKAFVGKVGAELWRYVADDELTAETLLHAPIWYPVQGEAMPLVKPEQPA